MKPDAVVLSPGPGHPRDAGCFTELLEQLPPTTPVLGVCLGHQALGLEAGGTVDRTAPMHGKASFVFHEGRGILEGISVPFEAGRYHSLVVERDDLPAELELTAWTEDGLVMGDPTPRAAALRRAVPPREHPHARGTADRRELPRVGLPLATAAGHPGP